MRVKAYREDAMRDAMFNDDTTPVDSNPFPTKPKEVLEPEMERKFGQYRPRNLKESFKYAIKESTFDLAPYGYTWCSKEGLVDSWDGSPGKAGQTTAAALLGSAMAFQSLFQPLRDWLDHITGFGEDDGGEWVSYQTITAKMRTRRDSLVSGVQ